MKQAWQRISVREQRLLQALGAFLLFVVAFSLVWQPTRQRLETIERQHQHQLALVAQLQRAQSRSGAPADSSQPLSLRISDSATAAGLDIHQMETDIDSVRLTLSGNANAVMQWLDGVEREGVVLQSLTLEKRDTLLEARVVFR
jgi:general secretion pathway protein M